MEVLFQGESRRVCMCVWKKWGELKRRVHCACVRKFASLSVEADWITKKSNFSIKLKAQKIILIMFTVWNQNLQNLLVFI